MAGQRSEWQSELSRLANQLKHTQTVKDDLLTNNGIQNAQLAKAGLDHLTSVKQYNDFLATSRRLDESVRQLDARLRNDTSMSSLERTNLAFLRWTLSCRPHYALRSHSPDAMSL